MLFLVCSIDTCNNVTPLIIKLHVFISGLSMPDSGSSVNETDFSGRWRNLQEMSRRSSTSGTRPGSPLPQMSMSAPMNSMESQSTHTSDFYPSSSHETAEQLLDRLQGTPDTLEKALTLNQALQRRLSANIVNLEKTLKENLQRQVCGFHFELK